MATGFTRSEITSEYQAALREAENEYKTSVEIARKLMESKKEIARETMQTKTKTLEQNSATQTNKTPAVAYTAASARQDVRQPQTFQDKSWNVSWNRTGVWSGSMPVRLFGH